MTDSGPQRDEAERPASALARVPTGAKVFLILSGGLLPLALIALFATLQTTRVADLEARARLRVAAAEGSRALANELVGDMTALRVALNTLERDPDNRPGCARVQGVFAQQFAAGTKFAVFGPQDRLLCGEAMGYAPPVPEPDERFSAEIIEKEGVLLSVRSDQSSAHALAFFPTDFLSRVARPSGFIPPYAASLSRDGSELALETLASHGPLDRRERIATPLGLDGMTLDMSVRAAPITSPLLVSMLLPLVMWAAAAGIGWFVVDRLLIRPLRRLHRSVGEYQPGEVIEPMPSSDMPAREIRELGNTFTDISKTVRAHEADLAEGLVRQTRLTREVHHRVKNNLQVIASLINFHARSAHGEEAGQAYASIQRRVDALAVVHRYHYAEMEENHGLELRSVLGELASNIRATAPASASGLRITLDLDPFLVSQDTAVAVAFLLTELVELAMKCSGSAAVNISLKPGDPKECATLRLSSPALVQSAAFDTLNETRYGRIITGLSRQLRAKLHYDPLVGAYEISIPVLGLA
ncbi:histidine kinase [Stakelama sp. CBK3Z-3]|uniref:histidine kinase n=1 Tax=Stakelama flava TaxID=2860338 RepID=A0ABS6XJS9_9SPHN|nr:histidine kinase dimerization/phosphoacceptor domain -containing protein [Stakelama flava]MBW4329700.1 histidine kinase [Stakelama flava]